MRYHIEKNTVQETLVIPLFGRLVCSERFPELFSDPEAKRIPLVREITEEIKACAGGAISGQGTGGMVTKVHAAEIAAAAGIDTYVLNGADPKAIYRLRDGEDLGTRFLGKE